LREVYDLDYQQVTKEFRKMSQAEWIMKKRKASKEAQVSDPSKTSVAMQEGLGYPFEHCSVKRTNIDNASSEKTTRVTTRRATKCDCVARSRQCDFSYTRLFDSIPRSEVRFIVLDTPRKDVMKEDVNTQVASPNKNTNDELTSKSSPSARTFVQKYDDMSLESPWACNDDEVKDSNDETRVESTTQETVLHTTAFESLIAVTSLPDVQVICTEKKKLNVNGYVWKRYFRTKFAANEEHKENTPSKPEYLPISVYTLERIVHFCACNEQHPSEYSGLGLRLQVQFVF